MADLADGESTEMKGSAVKPYVLTNTGGVYSCTCPAWRNQSISIERRTCKHLRKLRGDAAETERIGSALPAKPAKSDDGDEKAGPPLLLAQAWDNALDLADWWMSEKLDGVRAYWDGTQFISRQGNLYHAPDWFTAGLPATPLDGELWIDRGKFQRTVGIVRRQDKSDHWKEVRYLVFDAPRFDGNFEERLRFLTATMETWAQPYASLHMHEPCRSIDHLQQELARIESLGGEGLMLRQPGSRYEVGPSSTLLKVKTFHDAEAIVIAHQGGKGKHAGKLGAVVAQLPDGTEFSIGTGFSDAERAEPPAIGSSITFRYQELTDAGVPRFPSYVRLHQSAAKAQSSTIPPQKVAIKVVPNSAAVAVRYFEFVEGTSSKFWEINVDGNDVTVRYGRIGSQGTKKVTSLADESSAAEHAARLVDEKTAEGYVEK